MACVLGIVAAAAALGLATAPAGATPAGDPPPAASLTPVVDCIQDAPLGAVTSRTVVLGYRSTATAALEVAPGTGGNDFAPGAPVRGQPTTFLPGDHPAAWLLTVDAAAEPTVAWTLGGATATVDSSVPSCTDATAVTLSAPTTAADGGRVAVTAVVSRFLLGPPEDGTVTFSFDDAAPTTVPVAAGGVARADLPAPGLGDHTLIARFVPAGGSTLRAATATAALTVVPVSGPLTIVTDSVVAGSRSVLVTITRPSPVGPATAAFTTSDGTASAGTDYVATAGSVTFADGQSSATATVPLLSRQAGSPSSRFFVVLTRASIPVAAGVATVSLPAVPVAPAATVASPGGGGDAAGPASALPEADPTATATAARPAQPVGHDLLLILGALLVTAGGIAGVIGLFRAVRSRDAFS